MTWDEIYSVEKVAEDARELNGKLILLDNCQGKLNSELSERVYLYFEIYTDWPAIKYGMNHHRVEEMWRERISICPHMVYESIEATEKLIRGESNEELVRLKGTWDTVNYGDPITKRNCVIEGHIANNNSNLEALFRIGRINPTPAKILKQMDNADPRDDTRIYAFYE